MSQREAVVVVGGGIGGLACALAVSRAGFPVRLLEQAPEFSEIGAGIQLGPNFIRALDALGVKDTILADSWFPPNLTIRDALGGAVLTQIDSGEPFRSRFGEPYALIHRADLVRHLAGACDTDPDVELLPGRHVESIAEDGERVVVTTSAGEEVEGFALVGADGLWSTVR